MEIIKQWKNKRKIICYIYATLRGTYRLCTGKPSDIQCISWEYDNVQDAVNTGNEYFNNVTNLKLHQKTEII